MARQMNRLTPLRVKNVAETGRHSDGGGLYLSVSANGGRRWVFMYRKAGRQREIGLGSARAVTLATARQLAAQARELIAVGKDPRLVRGVSDCPKFGECADALLEAMKPGWRNPKHAAQWEMTLRDYAKPLRSMPISEVDTDAVLRVLKPLWESTPETASRLRGRIERVLDTPKAKAHRAGDNPARWRGHLDHMLPKRDILTRGHHKALPFAKLPGFMADLAARPATAARALEFTILTAARSGEVLGATWGEIDLEEATWTVPAARMKGKRLHRVPLSGAAVAILEAIGPKAPERPVFEGQKPKSPLSTMAMEMLLRRMDVDATVHGFRSSFRDWAAEKTDFPNEVCEAALAHVVGNKVEAAYRRGDLFEKRRQLMQAWADYGYSK